MIQKLSLEDSSYKPGEVLTHKSSEFTHITITYVISGDRYLIDKSINNAIEKDDNLIKVPYVDTTLYWQHYLGEHNYDESKLVFETENVLREKLKDIFLRFGSLDDVAVSVFCMVGNLRAFAFKLY